MNRRILVELKLAMEFGAAPVGNTLPEARSNGDGQPRLLVSLFGDDHAVFFRFDVPADVRKDLSALGSTALMRDAERVTAILARDASCESIYRIRWYTIERLADPAEYPDVTFVDGRHVIIIDGEIVGWARTDCETEHAAEVSIETHEAFRRRGYARQLTAAWAAQVLSSGKVAFYSHLLGNAPSQAVAESLGLVHLSDEIEYL
ncbi:MAG: GNAT family N-acetyltransferase [Chloroflexota bacterium]|nr:GNAT family N-acetyltransferase [Chloroflexota bacterium]